MAVDKALLDRVRNVLAGRGEVVEKRMVSGVSFLLDGVMCCGVTGDRLMIRVGAAARESVLQRPHVRPMVFGTKELAGFVCIEPDGIRTRAQLAAWIDQGLAFARSLSES